MSEQRRLLLLAHPGRAEARAVARKLVDALTGHDIHVRVLRHEATALGLDEIPGPHCWCGRWGCLGGL